MVAITPQLRSVKSFACFSLSVAIGLASSCRVGVGLRNFGNKSRLGLDDRRHLGSEELDRPHDVRVRGGADADVGEVALGPERLLERVDLLGDLLGPVLTNAGLMTENEVGSARAEAAAPGFTYSPTFVAVWGQRART